MTISKPRIVVFSRGKTLSLRCHLGRIFSTKIIVCKLRVVEEF